MQYPVIDSFIYCTTYICTSLFVMFESVELACFNKKGKDCFSVKRKVQGVPWAAKARDSISIFLSLQTENVDFEVIKFFSRC